MAVGECSIGGSGDYPCESGKKLLIQVTGINPFKDGQRLTFYKEDIKLPDIVEPDKSEFDIYYDCPSTLFEWETDKVKAHKLSLQIDREDGQKLNIPLRDHITANANYDNKNYYKWNQLLAFIPIAIHSYANLPSNTQPLRGYVHSRTGYLYIFVKNKLWRELEITQDKTNGWNLFKDTDVAGNRDDKGKLKEDQGCDYKQGATATTGYVERKPVGKALKEIWIPYRFGSESEDVKIIYCQSQMAAARINLLEEKGVEQSNYVQVAASKQFTAYDFSKDPVTDGDKIASYPVRLDNLTSKRPRTDDEWLLLHPQKHLADIKGNYLKLAYEATEKIDKTCCATEVPSSAIKTSDFDTKSKFCFEIDAWQNILKKHYAEDKTQDALWTEIKAVKDVFDDTKKRYIVGIPILDPLYTVQHLKTQLELAQRNGIYAYLSQRAKSRRFYPTAKFVNDMEQFTPTITNGINELEDEGRHLFKISIVDYERNYLYQKIKQWQEKLVKLLDTKPVQKALADILSNHIKEIYAANIDMLAKVLTTISKHPKAYDVIASTIQTEPTKGQLFIYKLASDPEHPIYKMLWPETSFDKLEQPLKRIPEAQKGDNTGEGHWYAPALQAVNNWDTQGQPPSEDLLKNIVAKTMLAQAESNKGFIARDLVRQEAKTGMAALFSILEALNGLVTEAQRAVADNAKYQQAKVQAEFKSNLANATSDRKKQELNERQRFLEEYDQTVGLQARRYLREKLGRLSEAEKAMLNASDLMHQGNKVFRMNTFMAGVEQLREILPEYFGDMHFVKYNHITGKSREYVILGITTADEMAKLDQLSSIPPSSGRIVDRATNELLGTSSSTVAKGFYEEVGELYLLAIPFNPQTKKLIENYAEAVRQHLIAMVEKLQAERLVATTESVKDLSRQELRRLIEEVEVNDKAAAAASKELGELMQQDYKYATAEYEVVTARGMTNKLEPLLKHPFIAGVVLLVEGWNVNDVMSQAKALEEKRSWQRANLGKLSATFDFTLALALFTEKVATYRQIQSLSWLKEILDFKVSGSIAQTLKIEGMAVRTVASSFGLALTAGISFWDAAYYFEQGNPAWKGYFMTGVGASMLTVQTAMVTTTRLLALVSGTLFIVGFALLGFGIYLSIVLDDEDKVKQWFIRGPFSDPTFGNFVRDNLNGTEGAYAYLADNNQAIYRLLSILLNIQGDIVENPDKATAQQELAKLQNTLPVDNKKIQELKNIANADLKIIASSNCAYFLQNYNLQKHIALFEETLLSTAVENYGTRKQIGEIDSNIFLTQEQPAGIVYYVSKYSPSFTAEFWTRKSTEYKWELRMQARGIGKADPQQVERVYPAPPLDDKTTFNPNKDSIVDYTDENQRFWYKKILPAT